MTPTPDNPPAFPCDDLSTYQGEPLGCLGMSTRTYIAARALPALITEAHKLDMSLEETVKACARDAVDYADALMEELSKEDK